MSRIVPFERAVYRFVRQEGGFPRGGRLLIACSGGPDSMALLYSMLQIAPKWSVSLGVAIMNHELRPEAAAEVAYVQSQAAHLGIPCYATSVDVARLAKETKQSVELAGREARYAWLRQVAETEGYDGIVVAHHKDDQCETILAHLLRGAGPAGLAGMRFHQEDIYRPLLGVTKVEIQAYLTELGVHACIDETNFEPCYQRNRIRLELVPLLKTFNPQIVEACHRLGCQMQDEVSFWEDEIPKVVRGLVLSDAGDWILDRKALRSLHRTVQGKVWQWIYKTKVDASGSFTFGQLSELESLVKSGERKEFSIRQMKVVAQYGKIEISFKI